MNAFKLNNLLNNLDEQAGRLDNDIDHSRNAVARQAMKDRRYVMDTVAEILENKDVEAALDFLEETLRGNKTGAKRTEAERLIPKVFAVAN